MKTARITLIFGGLAAMTLFSNGCSREPFRIQPKADSPPEVLTSTAAGKSLSIRARALRDENESNDRFDANHLLAGIMPVEIRLENTASGPVSLDGIRFRLRDAKGKEWPALTPDQSVKQLAKYYKLRAYNVDGFNTFREKYRGYGLPSTGQLQTGGTTQGFLFFRMPKDTHDFAQPLTLVLRSERNPALALDPVRLD